MAPWIVQDGGPELGIGDEFGTSLEAGCWAWRPASLGAPDAIRALPPAPSSEAGEALYRVTGTVTQSGGGSSWVLCWHEIGAYVGELDPGCDPAEVDPSWQGSGSDGPPAAGQRVEALLTLWLSEGFTWPTDDEPRPWWTVNGITLVEQRADGQRTRRSIERMRRWEDHPSGSHNLYLMDLELLARP